MALAHLKALLGDNLATALRSIWSNRQRAVLTALGVITGCMAFTAAYGILWGKFEGDLRELRRLGATYVSVSGRDQVRAEDGAELVAQIPSLAHYSPVYSAETTAATPFASADAKVVGGAAALRALFDLRVSAGRFFTASEVDAAADVCVVGAELAQNLRLRVEGDAAPTIELFGQPFRVVGVMERRRGDMPGCGEYGRCVVVPHLTLRELSPRLPLAFLAFKAVSEQAVPPAVTAIRYRLRRMLQLSSMDRDPFEVHQASGVIERIEREMTRGSAIIMGVVCLTLLVGGIGVMNIMLVTVVERTPEIGLRKALGARSREILMQFLIESLCLCTAGGILGTGLGVLIAFSLIDTVAPGMQPVLPFGLILTSLGFAVATGVSFGFTPALKAARLSPMEALRRE